MVKNIVKIEGMACGMCESHIADCIRKVLPEAKSVKASHTKNQAEFLTEQPASEELLKKTIEATGYHYISMRSEPYEKKGLFGFLK